MTESAGAVISEMRAQRDRAMARVKELEAELAMKEHLIRERDSLDRDAKYWYKAYNDEVFAFNETLARAEKAEAEVERLEEALSDSKHWPHIVESIYDPMCVRCKPRVNPSGDSPSLPKEATPENDGGRESGLANERTPTGKASSDESVTSEAAANPAALRRYHEVFELTGDQEAAEAAARKECDDG